MVAKIIKLPTNQIKSIIHLRQTLIKSPYPTTSISSLFCSFSQLNRSIVYPLLQKLKIYFKLLKIEKRIVTLHRRTNQNLKMLNRASYTSLFKLLISWFIYRTAIIKKEKNAAKLTLLKVTRKVHLSQSIR